MISTNSHFHSYQFLNRGKLCSDHRYNIFFLASSKIKWGILELGWWCDVYYLFDAHFYTRVLFWCSISTQDSACHHFEKVRTIFMFPMVEHTGDIFLLLAWVIGLDCYHVLPCPMFMSPQLQLCWIQQLFLISWMYHYKFLINTFSI